MKTQSLGAGELICAAQLLKEGKLVAFPTETVYGLGAPIFNPAAIAEIFRVKGRPADNPLIAHISDLAQVELLAREIPPLFYALAEQFFPGPLTLILKRHSRVPPIVSAGLSSIALRMPAHPLAQQLISLVGEPLVAPSANISGTPSSTEASHVLNDFDGKIAAVVDGGQTACGIESTVISLLDERPLLMRLGAVSKEAVEDFLGCSLEMGSKGESPVSPGMKYRHYAPQAPIRLFYDLNELQSALESACPSKKRMLLSRLSFPSFSIEQFPLSAPNLYASLRHADCAGYGEVWIYCDDLILKDLAMMNRISRAAEN